MSQAFEELDYCRSELGELILRRRRPVSQPDQWVYEVKLAGRFLMSSLNTESERELATRALARTTRDQLRVMVGGLGLGYTAAAALADARVAVVEVIERLPEVIAWHRRGLVPLGDSLCNDARCRLIVGDCLQQLSRGAGPPYDVILIDIDDFADPSARRGSRRLLFRCGADGDATKTARRRRVRVVDQPADRARGDRPANTLPSSPTSRQGGFMGSGACCR